MHPSKYVFRTFACLLKPFPEFIYFGDRRLTGEILAYIGSSLAVNCFIVFYVGMIFFNSDRLSE
jgi:hypothetical protein